MNPSATVVGMCISCRAPHSSIIPFIAPILFALLLLTDRSMLYAQDRVVSREEDSLANVAIRFIDAGEYERARQILHDGEKRFPGNSLFPYELAYILYIEKKYQECQTVMLTIMDSPDVSDRFFQLLGNTYDLLGNSSEAIAVYERGLRRFPNSGPLHLERGMMSLASDPEQSMRYWEKGIERDPSFPSNYLYAARQWFRSSNPGWGHIYGEIFLNMEPTGNRADLMREELVASLLSSMTTEQSHSGDTLTVVAKISLFERQKSLREAGLFEAYNFWMFQSKATRQEAAEWWRAHPSKSGELLAWMGTNRMPATRATVFARPLLKGIPLPKGDDGGLGE